MQSDDRQLRTQINRLKAQNQNLKKRVADLETEITQRCQNYMSIIEKLKKGQGVTIMGTTKSQRNSRHQATSPVTEPVTMEDVAVQAFLDDEGMQQVQKIQQRLHKSESKQQHKQSLHTSERKVQRLLEMQFKKQEQIKKQEAIQVSTMQPIMTQQVISNQQVQQQVKQEEIQQVQQQQQSHPQSQQQPQQPQSQKSQPQQQTTQQLHQLNMHKTCSSPVTRPSVVIRQLQTHVHQLQSSLNHSHSVNVHKSAQMQQMYKYKALFMQLLNHKTPSMQHIKELMKKHSQPGSQLVKCFRLLQSHIDTIVTKMRYYETIIYSVDGHPQKAKGKYNSAKMEQQIDRVFSNIKKVEDQNNSIKAQRNLLIAKNRQIQQNNQELLQKYQQEQQKNQTLQQQHQTLQQQLSQSKIKKLQKSQGSENGSVKSGAKSQSSKKNTYVEMAKHHMIMFPKQEECRQCQKNKEMYERKLEQMTDQKDVHISYMESEQEKMVKRIKEYEDKITELDREIQQLKYNAKNQQKNAPLNRVGMEETDLPVEDDDFVKRKFLRTTRIKKTESTIHAQTKNLSKQEVATNLKNKIVVLNSKLNEKKDEGTKEEVEALEKVRDKFVKLTKIYEDEAVSERSSTASQCQQAETSVIEVKFEFPTRTVQDIKIVENRKYVARNLFDFKKKPSTVQALGGNLTESLI